MGRKQKSLHPGLILQKIFLQNIHLNLFQVLDSQSYPSLFWRSLVSRKVLHDCVQKCLETPNIWGTLGHFFFSLSGRQVVGQKFRWQAIYYNFRDTECAGQKLQTNTKALCPRKKARRKAKAFCYCVVSDLHSESVSRRLWKVTNVPSTLQFKYLKDLTWSYSILALCSLKHGFHHSLHLQELLEKATGPIVSGHIDEANSFACTQHFLLKHHANDALKSLLSPFTLLPLWSKWKRLEFLFFKLFAVSLKTS